MKVTRREANQEIKKMKQRGYNRAEKEAVYLSRGGKLHGRRMDARSCPVARSPGEDPSCFSA